MVIHSTFWVKHHIREDNLSFYNSHCDHFKTSEFNHCESTSHCSVPLMIIKQKISCFQTLTPFHHWLYERI